MGFSGAFPSENSSGKRIRKGGISKAGKADDYAVPTREYQLDQWSQLPASAAVDPVLERKKDQRTLTGHYISFPVCRSFVPKQQNTLEPKAITALGPSWAAKIRSSNEEDVDA